MSLPGQARQRDRSDEKAENGVGATAVLLAGILAILRVTGLEPYMDYTTYNPEV